MKRWRIKLTAVQCICYVLLLNVTQDYIWVSLLHYLRILLYLNVADDIADDVYNLICKQALGKYLLNVSDVTLVCHDIWICSKNCVHLHINNFNVI